MLTINVQSRPTIFQEFWKIIRVSTPIINRAVAYACIIVIALRHYLQVPHLEEGAIWALGFIVLNGIFSMTQALANKPRRQSFNNIVDARDAILECAKDSNERDKYLEVEWLGMTMLNAWSILALVFEDLRHNSNLKDLRFKVAMLDGDWLSKNIINSAWTKERVHTSMVNMLAYFESLADKGLSSATCEISCYSHMPGIHGGLINGKYLFLGVCQWKDGNLHAGECQYYLYTFKNIDDVKKIEIFQNWFNYCNKQQKVKVTSSHATGIPALTPKVATV